MEPERKIEKWLKAYAKKRRTQAGEPFRLHPATRQLLQSEVARDKPKPDDEDESVSLWEVIRQQWAILLSFAACIFLVGIILLPFAYYAKKKAEPAMLSSRREAGHIAQESAEPGNAGSLEEKKDNEVAQNAFVSRYAWHSTNNPPSPTVAMTVTPSAAPEVSQSIEAKPLEVSPGTSGIPPVSAGGPYIVAQPGEAAPVATNNLNGIYAAAAAPIGSFPTGQTREQSQETIPAAAPPVEMPPQQRNALAFSDTIHSRSELRQAAQLDEVQNAYKNLDMPPGGQVLANFQVRQNGNAIRLIDKDGSVYDGWLQLASRQAEKVEGQTAWAAERLVQNGVAVETGLPDRQIAAAQDAFHVAQDYFFHVYGTNRTMKQTVAFTGHLVMNSAPATNAQGTFAFSTNDVWAGEGGFGGAGGGGGGGAVGGVFDRTKSETTNQVARLPWANLRITGTAFINRTNRIEVNATPVAPK